jgi:perosamine synthetase
MTTIEALAGGAAWTDLRSAAPTFEAEDIEAIQADLADVLRSGVLTAGPHVEQFEREYAAYCGTTEAVAVSNGTAALEVIYRAINVEGKDVVVPTNTFLSTANAVAFAGGRPVFADLDPSTLCIGLDDVERAITPRTAAVVVVHIAGLVCPVMDELRQLCRDRGIVLIEDAAHAHGATYKARRAGALADAGAFSFFPTKPMTTAEGGMVTTNDPYIAAYARRFRAHGVDPERGLHIGLGHNYRLSEINAIIGRRQLARLNEHLERRRQVAAIYDQAFAGVPALDPVTAPAGQLHSYYKYPLVVPDVAAHEALTLALKQQGIPTGNVYNPPCHLHPYAREAYAVGPGDFPRAEDVLPRVICLPIHAGLDAAQAERVADIVLEQARRVGLT